MGALILGKSKLGMGVFANQAFRKGEEIIEFKGRLMKRRQLPEIVKPEDDRHLQIGKDAYLGSSGGYDDFFNHSCNPNSGVQVMGKRAFLIAIKNIRKGKEITFDYSTTIDEDTWAMDCACKSKNCRKRLRDFRYLPKRVQQRYIALGVIPKYVLENVKRSRE